MLLIYLFSALWLGQYIGQTQLSYSIRIKSGYIEAVWIIHEREDLFILYLQTFWIKVRICKIVRKHNFECFLIPSRTSPIQLEIGATNIIIKENVNSALELYWRWRSLLTRMYYIKENWERFICIECLKCLKDVSTRPNHTIKFENLCIC